MKAAADIKNLWKIIIGEEDILGRPSRPSRPDQLVFHPKTRSEISAEVRAAQEQAFKEHLNEYQISINEYKLDLDDFEKQDACVRLVRGLLASTVDQAIRGCISYIEQPREAIDQIKFLCKMSDT